MLDVLRQCRKEIAEFPEEIRGEIADAAARLNQGLMLSMPLSRPMPSIWRTRAKVSASIRRISGYLRDPGKAWRLVGSCIPEEDRANAAAKHRDRETQVERGAMKRTSESQRLAKMFSISQARGMEAVIKAQLISAVLKKVEDGGITHAELAKKADIPRSAVTGILSGSLQRVTIDRILKMVEAVGLIADVRVRDAA